MPPDAPKLGDLPSRRSPTSPACAPRPHPLQRVLQRRRVQHRPHGIPMLSRRSPRVGIPATAPARPAVDVPAPSGKSPPPPRALLARREPGTRSGRPHCAPLVPYELTAHQEHSQETSEETAQTRPAPRPLCAHYSPSDFHGGEAGSATADVLCSVFRDAPGFAAPRVVFEIVFLGVDVPARSRQRDFQATCSAAPRRFSRRCCPVAFFFRLLFEDALFGLTGLRVDSSVDTYCGAVAATCTRATW